MKNKIKKGLKIVLLIGLSVLISYCMIDLRRGTSALSFLQGFLSAILIDPSAFFIFTILCLWKLRLNNPRSTALLIAIGSSIEIIGILYATTVYGERLEDIHPLSLVELIMRYMAIFAAYITFTRRRWSSRIIISLLTAMTIVWMSWERCGFHLRLSDFQELEGPRNSNDKVPAQYPECPRRDVWSRRFQRFVSASRLLEYQLRRMLPGVSNSAGTL